MKMKLVAREQNSHKSCVCVLFCLNFYSKGQYLKRNHETNSNLWGKKPKNYPGLFFFGGDFRWISKVWLLPHSRPSHFFNLSCWNCFCFQTTCAPDQHTDAITSSIQTHMRNITYLFRMVKESNNTNSGKSL